MWGKHTPKNKTHQTSFSDTLLKHTPASSETIIHITPCKLQAVSAEPLHVWTVLCRSESARRWFYLFSFTPDFWMNLKSLRFDSQSLLFFFLTFKLKPRSYWHLRHPGFCKSLRASMYRWGAVWFETKKTFLCQNNISRGQYELLQNSFRLAQRLSGDSSVISYKRSDVSRGSDGTVSGGKMFRREVTWGIGTKGRNISCILFSTWPRYFFNCLQS